MERWLCVTSHYGTTNLNHNEILLHRHIRIVKIKKIQHTKCLVRVQESWNTQILLVKMQNSATALKNSLAVC